MTVHVCHAVNCWFPVTPRMLFCADHWCMLPKTAQSVIYREYRAGQERDKRPSARYLVAQAMVVAFVAGKDGIWNRDQIDAFIIQRVKDVGMDGSEAIEILTDMAAHLGQAAAPAEAT